MDVELLDDVLLVGSLVLGLAILGAQLSNRFGLPSLLVYLLIGIALGEAGFQFDDASTAHALGFAALVVILTEGGLTTRWADVRPAMPMGLSLATVGVAVSTGVVAMVVHYGLGVSWTISLLLGGILASTDAAAVFSVLRRVPLRPRTAGALESESGLNDAPTVLLVTLVAAGEVGESGWLWIAATVVLELVGGAIIGVATGFAAAWLLRRVALPGSGLYPLAVMVSAVLAYGLGSFAHASGFAAVYLAALVLGNSDLPHGSPTRSFAEGTAWLAQIGLFVMLGLLAEPSRIDVGIVATACLVGVLTVLLARPISVGVALLPFRTRWRDQAFLSLAGLRGAVPVVLATIPLSEGVEGSVRLFDVVFVTVVLLTLVQTPPLPWLAGRLGQVTITEPRDLEVEVAPLDRVDADLLQVSVTSGSRLQGVEIAELRLPKGASVAMIVRRGAAFVPSPTTMLRRGDDVILVVPRGELAAAERRLRRISRYGRLAGWLRESEE
jgi:cell volume regulation protein A